MADSDQALEMLKNLPNLPPEVQKKLLDGPAMFPPPGVMPNFDNPANHNSPAYALLVICVCLVFVFFALRVYVRVIVAKKVRIEDGLAFCAVASFGAFAWDYVAFSRTPGFWVHQYDVQLKNMGKFVMVGIWLPILYSLTMMFAKNAILLEWIRIFVPGRNRNLFWWSCVAVMVANTVFYSVTIILEGLACIPLKALWQPWVHGKCFDKKALDTTTAYVNLFVDLSILLLPQWVIWKLQMSRNQKIGVSMIFSVGIISVACAIGRVIFNYRVQYVGSKPGDLVYTIAPLYFWLLAEVTCVIIVLCMPSIPKAFKESYGATRIVASFRSWTRMRTGNSQGTSRSGHSASHRNVQKIAYNHSEDGRSDKESQVELTSFDSAERVGSAEQRRYEDANANNRILRHTHIAVRTTSDKGFRSEHSNYPWERK